MKKRRDWMTTGICIGLASIVIPFAVVVPAMIARMILWVIATGWFDIFTIPVLFAAVGVEICLVIWSWDILRTIVRGDS